MGKTRILLMGAGGYGAGYVRQLASAPPDADWEWVGVADPYAARSPEWDRIAAAGVPVFDTPEAFYAVSSADLAVIVTPIPLHAPQCITAMEHGSDVLLEKPIAGSTETAKTIIDARDRLGRRLFLGYQWCYDPVMHRLKDAADRGDFGRPVRMRSLVLWPRDHAYYGRNSWAGRKTVDGHPVWDSVSSNAAAHYLFNMLWLAGPDYTGISPLSCEAFTARANDIETFDTAVMRFVLKNGTEVLHAASHAAGTAYQQEPMFRYEYENAVISFGGYGELPGPVTVRYRDGRELDFGVSDLSGANKLRWVIDAVRHPETPNVCPAEAAVRHTEAIELARASSREPLVFRNVREDGGFAWVPGLADCLRDCYESFTLPAPDRFWDSGKGSAL